MFVFFWFGIFWFHFRFYVTQITCFGLSVFSWNTWPRGTPGAQAGVAQSQGQCPADHGCEYVPPAWAASCLALSETHPCTVWSVHPRLWVLFHLSADVRAAQSVDIWVVSTAGLLRVVLLWSFSVGLWWTGIRHLCCCGHGVIGQAVSTPPPSAGPCLLSPSWGVCLMVPSSVLTLASWCSGCFSCACGLCEPSF